MLNWIFGHLTLKIKYDYNYIEIKKIYKYKIQFNGNKCFFYI